MTRFERQLLFLTALFLLGLGIVTARMARPLPLRPESPARSHSVEVPKLDINSADADALCALPGIGPVTAARIIAHREAHGPFTSLEDLLLVEGIGEKTLENIYKYMEEN